MTKEESDKIKAERSKLNAKRRERLAKIRKLANEAWETCQGCTEEDKNVFIIGFVLGFNSGHSISIR